MGKDIAKNSGQHLCYSLNILKEPEDFSADSAFFRFLGDIRSKSGFSMQEPFAAGLWMGSNLVRILQDKRTLERLSESLTRESIYVFTLNAFPYGGFHGKRIKENVYLPDWSEDSRLEFTNSAADILSFLMPSGVKGSISTVPGGYREFSKSSGIAKKMGENIRKAAEHLAKIHETTGKEIVLALEPEPDCLIETPGEFISFIKDKVKAPGSIMRHIGVCYDCSHYELMSPSPGSALEKYLDAGIPVAKIHLSAALGAPSPESKAELANFADEVYLHQTRVFGNDGNLSRYPDLPDALKNADPSLPWKIHYHIPVFSEGLPGGLVTEKSELLKILEMLRTNPEICSNLEIETYTYSVLPESMRKRSLADFIAEEYKWIVKRMR